MLALHLTLLTDRYCASSYNNRTETEWPPHPARVYSALVDALYADGPVPDPTEASALDALATLGAPRIMASTGAERRVMTHFVPVNDADQVGGSFDRFEGKVRDAEVAVADAESALEVAKAKEHDRAAKRLDKARAALDKARGQLLDALRSAADPGSRGGTPKGAALLLPWSRTKQPRTFPAFVPENPVVTYAWPDASVDEATVAALDDTARRVVRVGHSSSFVLIRVDPSWRLSPDDSRGGYEPNEEGGKVIRLPAPGQRLALDEAFERHRGQVPGRIMPAAYQNYAPIGTSEEIGRSVRNGGRWVVYQVIDGAYLPAHAAAALGDAVRGGVLRYAEEPAPALLTGHAQDGPLSREHLAVLPLPFVAHPHADGVIRGFALSLPAGASRDEDGALLRALGTWERAASTLIESGTPRRIEVGVSGGVRMVAERIVDDSDALATLKLTRWSRPSTRWATVTPIVLDGQCSSFRHERAGVRNKAFKTAAKLIRAAVCRMVVAPEGATLAPTDVEVSLVFDAPILGAAALGRVPPFRRGPDAPRRRMVHAEITLPFPIRGPLVLGAGRHFGLGLCMPLQRAAHGEGA